MLAASGLSIVLGSAPSFLPRSRTQTPAGITPPFVLAFNAFSWQQLSRLDFERDRDSWELMAFSIFVLAQATLDDVFLRATGHHLEVDKKAEAEAAAAAGGAA